MNKNIAIYFIQRAIFLGFVEDWKNSCKILHYFSNGLSVIILAIENLYFSQLI